MYVRTAEQLAVMRRAGRVVAEMHECTRAAIRAGVTTRDLDQIARDVLERRDATSNFLGYHGYPAVICASVNDTVVHGIPDDTPLVDGDIVSIDCGAIVDGWHGDAAYTVGVGEIADAAARLVDATEASLATAIATMVAGAKLSDIGHAVQTTVERAGFEVVREYTGHGIGEQMHEEPSVPNFGRPGRGPRLIAGNVLAIEPMATAGGAGTRTLADGWTVVTIDGSLAAHAEHTVVVTDDGPEVLTRP